MPEEIGISVYPLPGTKFFDKVKDQLKGKSNWTDSSDELALMYKGTFSPSYYKKLHRYVHKVYRRKQSLSNLKNVLSNPLSMNKKKMRSLSALYYIPASIADSIVLKKLETAK